MYVLWLYRLSGAALASHTVGEKYDGLLLMDTDARALDEHMPHLFPNKTRKAALDARAHPLCTSIWSLSGTSSTAAGGGERARHPGRYAPHPYGGGGGGAWGVLNLISPNVFYPLYGCMVSFTVHRKGESGAAGGDSQHPSNGGAQGVKRASYGLTPPRTSVPPPRR